MPDPATAAYPVPPLAAYMEHLAAQAQLKDTRYERIKRVREAMLNVKDQYTAKHGVLEWVLRPETLVVQDYAEAVVDLIEDEAVRMVKGEK